MQFSRLSDQESELFKGGYSPIQINTLNAIRVDASGPKLEVNNRIVTASQLNNAVSVSAFGGVNSSFRAQLITQQVNELYFV